MVKPDFSEFQFAYGVTRELESALTSSIIAPPIFPTQRKEEHIASDVVIPGMKIAPLFIQYKRSDRMVRSNAGEWADFNQEYYRFDIHTANQHNTLVDIGQSLGTACYIAPGFHTRQEYIQYHKTGSLTVNSVCVHTRGLSKISHDDHKVAYTVSPLQGFFYSEPKQVSLTENIYSVIDRIRDVGEDFRTPQALRESFREARNTVTDRMNIELDTEDYESDNIAGWIRNQQQFFWETSDIELLFVTSDLRQ